jgi:hypothetical protein
MMLGATMGTTLLMIPLVFVLPCCTSDQSYRSAFSQVGCELKVCRAVLKEFADDVCFGQKQISDFIADRPGTFERVKSDPALYLALIWYFAGEMNNGRVCWDSQEPVSGRPAEHVAALSEFPARVRVSSENSISPGDKWAMLLFEMFNHQLDDQYSKLVDGAISKTVGREEFAIDCLQLEFLARQNTRKFFRRFPLTPPKLGRDETYDQIMGESENFSDYLRWLNGLNKKAYDPRRYYGKMYDNVLRSGGR